MDTEVYTSKKNYAILALNSIINPDESDKLKPVLEYFKEMDQVKSFDVRDQENEITKSKLNFARQCVLVGGRSSVPAKELTLLEFYTIIEMLQKKPAK